MWHLILVRRIGTILAGWICLAAIAAHAAHTQARLILSAETAKPGDTVLAGVDLKMEPGWHTYWKNPGAAGYATKIEWQLPPGVTAGEIQWPLPEKLPPAEVTTYGYDDEVILRVPLKLAADLKPGPLDLKAKVSWLECKEACIPGSGDVEASLNIGDQTKASADAALIQSWQSKTPAAFNPRGDYLLLVWWENPANDDTRPLIIGKLIFGKEQPMDATKNIKCDSIDFFPDASDQFEIQGATEIISAYSADIRLRKLVKKFSGDWPKEISGVLVTESGGLRTGIEDKLSVSDQAPVGETISAQTSPESRTGVAPVSNFSERKSGQNMETGATPVLPSQPLWQMLLYAFIGGLILNIMPCVLPVIAANPEATRVMSASSASFMRSACWCRFSRSLSSSLASRPPDTAPAGACNSVVRFLSSASPRWSCSWP
jgi:thiol:disulfide interchange protein DsbD